MQKPKYHLKGQGCPKCATDGTRLTLEEFIKKANIEHDFKYTYANVEYINTRTPVLITCKDHGDFMQVPRDHLRGSGCPTCADNSNIGYDKMSPEERQLHKPGHVYIVRMIGNDGEMFDKIGITKRKPKKRFDEFANYVPIAVECKEYENIDIAWNKEKDLHDMFNLEHYKPKNRFGGSTKECFKPLPYKFREEVSQMWLEGEPPSNMDLLADAA